jgi:hypothetical protein
MCGKWWDGNENERVPQIFHDPMLATADKDTLGGVRPEWGTRVHVPRRGLESTHNRACSRMPQLLVCGLSSPAPIDGILMLNSRLDGAEIQAWRLFLSGLTRS